DVVELDLPMQTQRVEANAKVEADAGRFALKRGPLVYCLEGRDQTDDRVLNMLIPDSAVIRSTYDPNLLGGIQTLHFSGFLVK
ncbi:MAG: glycoside hydrolase family 127 protein, partial [Thermoanaerobaculia bacterium]|nr:glycoside hydrolase family 127 protein [Thermoanaerobaculia bacterium]